MAKICRFCHKEFVAEGKNSWKKSFCDIACQQAYWAIKRNKTGLSTKNCRDRGKEVRRQNIHLSPEQLQIVYGTMMGDASISPRPNGQCRMQISHCEKQLPYLDYKAEKLRPFFIQPNATMFVSSGWGTESRQYKQTSIVHQDFTDIFGLFYKTVKGSKRKHVTPNILNKMEAMSVLFWFLDDGSFYLSSNRKGSTIHLSTYNCTLSEHRMMKKWFWHKWNIHATISYDSTHDCYYLRFSKEAQILFDRLFLKPFKHLVPSCMHYKFPEF